MGKIYAALALALCMALPAWAQRPAPLSLEPELDVQRYLGRWYEIARFDKSFERGLVGCTAEYSLRKDGKITVRNSGFKKDLNGKLSVARGIARIPNPKQPRALKVSFFWPFEGDYLIFALDPEYQWALVGDNTRNYLWILARQYQLEPELLESLKDLIVQNGFDVSRLYFVPQKPRD